MMVKIKHFSFLFLVVIYQVHHVCGKTRIDQFLSPKNDFVRIIDSLGFPLSGFREPSIAVKVLSHLDKYWQNMKHNFFLRRMELENFIENISHSKCLRDMSYSIYSAFSGDTWAIEMLDAFGKPESGILKGNVKWLGDYNECINIYAPPAENTTALGDFHFQYCTLNISFDLSTKTRILYGVCIPDSCHLDNIEHYVEKFIKSYSEFLPFLGRIHLPVYINDATCQPTSKRLTSDALAMLIVVGILVLLVVIGSLITACEYFARGMLEERTDSSGDMQMIIRTRDYGSCETIPTDGSMLSSYDRENAKHTQLFGKWGSVVFFFKCFCCFTNGGILFSSGSREQLLCVNGIRVLSFCWVLLFQLFFANLEVTGNVSETRDLIDKWAYKIILNPNYSLDSFFFISGFLLGHLFFKEFSRGSGKISWLNFYLHRYIRLTPPYMLVLGIFATLLYYAGHGPFATTTEVQQLCSENWWQNLLYINNFFENSCMRWAWYLAVEMQFFIISPLFLVTLWRWPKIGYSLVGLFISVTFLLNFALTYVHNLGTGFGDTFQSTRSIEYILDRYNKFFNTIYDKPYTRFSPYLVGMVVAYYLFQKNNDKGKRLHWFSLSVGWVFSTSISLFGLFCIYHTEDIVLRNSFYNGLIHIAYPVCLGWVVLVCCSKQADIVNSILSCKIFQPLSRLTYSAYLIHYFLIRGYLQRLQRPFHYSHETMVLLFLGFILKTYFFALIAHLLLEAPFIRIERFVKSRWRFSSK